MTNMILAIFILIIWVINFIFSVLAKNMKQIRIFSYISIIILPTLLMIIVQYIAQNGICGMSQHGLFGGELLFDNLRCGFDLPNFIKIFMTDCFNYIIINVFTLLIPYFIYILFSIIYIEGFLIKSSYYTNNNKI